MIVLNLKNIPYLNISVEVVECGGANEKDLKNCLHGLRKYLKNISINLRPSHD